LKRRLTETLRLNANTKIRQTQNLTKATKTCFFFDIKNEIFFWK
jgi:hypothetical protein